MTTTTLLDPTGEHEVVARRKAPRPNSLDGITVGVLDIGKLRGDVFLDRIAERLGERGIPVKRYAKPGPSRPAIIETRQKMMAETQVAVIGLADWGSCTSCSLHDACNLEGSGIPALVVATTAFVQAADAQSKALGYEPTMVWVPHPIQDRTDQELRAIADNAFDEIVARMTAAR